MNYWFCFPRLAFESGEVVVHQQIAVFGSRLRAKRDIWTSTPQHQQSITAKVSPSHQTSISHTRRPNNTNSDVFAGCAYNN